MKRGESLYPADWLRIGEKDIKRVGQLLDLHDPEAAGFYLQQGVEKFLKAFLLSRGWALQRIHDLEPLLNEALAFDTSLEQYRDVLQRITGLYFVERYPLMLDAGLSEKDVAEALKRVDGLLDSIRQHLTNI